MEGTPLRSKLERFERELISLFKALSKQGVALRHLAAPGVAEEFVLHPDMLPEGVRLKDVFRELSGGVFHYMRHGHALVYNYAPPVPVKNEIPLKFLELMAQLKKIAPEVKLERVPCLDTRTASTGASILSIPRSYYASVAEQILDTRPSGLTTLYWSAEPTGVLEFLWKEAKAAREPPPLVEEPPSINLSALATTLKMAAPPTASVSPAPSTGVLGVKRHKADEPEAPQQQQQQPMPTLVLSFPKVSKN